MPSLLEHYRGTERFQGLHDLLGILLRYGLLEDLWRGLNELLGLYQAEAEQVLDLLDNLGLGSVGECHQLDVEEGLLCCGRGGLLDLDGYWRRGAGGKATDG